MLDKETEVKDSSGNIITMYWESDFLIQITEYERKNYKIVKEVIRQKEKQTNEIKIVILCYKYINDDLVYIESFFIEKGNIVDVIELEVKSHN